MTLLSLFPSIFRRSVTLVGYVNNTLADVPYYCYFSYSPYTVFDDTQKCIATPTREGPTWMTLRDVEIPQVVSLECVSADGMHQLVSSSSAGPSMWGIRVSPLDTGRLFLPPLAPLPVGGERPVAQHCPRQQPTDRKAIIILCYVATFLLIIGIMAAQLYYKILSSCSSSNIDLYGPGNLPAASS